MKWSRTKDKDKASIISKKIQNPDITLRELEEETWVDLSTAWRIIQKDLPEVAKSSEIISKIIENDMESVHIMSLITKRFAKETLLKEQLERADVSVANQTVESAFKRSQIFQDKPTEIINVDWADILRKIQNWEITKNDAYNALRQSKE